MRSLLLGLLLTVPLQEDFAKVLQKQIEAAPDGFASLRGKPQDIFDDGAPLNWEATLILPGAAAASISRPPQARLSNAYLRGPDAEVMEKHASLVKQVRKALSEEWKTTEEKGDDFVETTFRREGDPKSPSVIVSVAKRRLSLLSLNIRNP